MGDFEREQNDEQSVEFIPATKTVTYMDSQMFATIMCMIPAGRLTTQEAICKMWAKRKNRDYCEVQGGILPFDKSVFWYPTDVQRVDFISDLQSYGKVDEENRIPYWRIVSSSGTLVDFGRYYDKEMQKKLLEREGHVITQPNPNRRLYRVQNYKAALFDLDKLIITE